MREYMHILRIVTLRHIIVTPLTPAHNRFPALCDDVTLFLTHHAFYLLPALLVPHYREPDYIRNCDLRVIES